MRQFCIMYGFPFYWSSLFSCIIQLHFSFVYGEYENWGITLDEDWLNHVKNVQGIFRKRKTENLFKNKDQVLETHGETLISFSDNTDILQKKISH